MEDLMAHENVQQFTGPEERALFHASLKLTGHQFCPKCQSPVPLEGFAKSSRGQHGAYCKACKKTINRDLYRSRVKTDADRACGICKKTCGKILCYKCRVAVNALNADLGLAMATVEYLAKRSV